ncbi:hypothetical protein [Metabacillus indicus]|uniref:PDGLE domain-containing protein n=1 Tax=Metabacillus indicus TaxID=246786 RepID=A0A084H286_METID|nr:hypothetical protein [Metabacillus indicus]KEZ53698.1 hypothetical protein GS18_0201620 [Metabacillus indicus]
MNIFRVVGILFLALLSYAAFTKGMELKALGANVDGDGMGLSFLGVPFVERLPEESIPHYAAGFLLFSGMVGILSLIFLVQSVTRRVEKQA